MLTLRNDQLTFTFPQIADALRRLFEEHEQATLPSLLAEDRAAALQKLRGNWRYRNADSSKQKEAERRIQTTAPDEIAEIFRRRCRAIADDAEPRLELEFQRTLRIPDEGKIYPLPAGLGRFPLRDIDDFAAAVPPSWLERGGVLMPMHQSEALWIYFHTSYPFALKVGAGKINALTGERWTDGLTNPPQNYLVLPEQPWLDGFAVGKGVIRQFVAMPLGAGYSAEEQITGAATCGGLQVQLHPMKAEACFRRQIATRLPHSFADLVDELLTGFLPFSEVQFCRRDNMVCEEGAMGLGAGGTMRQEIFADPHDFADWDTTLRPRCFVHLCNSLVWRQITGENPPYPPLTAHEYKAHRVPWFDYYREDLKALEGSAILNGIKSVVNFGKAKGDKPVADNGTVDPERIIQYGNARRPDEVREWSTAAK
jgi:hypothetical protein